jgi:hypothetical protein
MPMPRPQVSIMQLAEEDLRLLRRCVDENYRGAPQALPSGRTVTAADWERLLREMRELVLDPGTRDPDVCAANLASLNEIIAEMVQAMHMGTRPDGDFVALVGEELREHTWSLGYAFRGQEAPPEWYERREEELHPRDPEL